VCETSVITNYTIKPLLVTDFTISLWHMATPLSFMVTFPHTYFVH